MKKSILLLISIILIPLTSCLPQDTIDNPIHVQVYGFTTENATINATADCNAGSVTDITGLLAGNGSIIYQLSLPAGSLVGTTDSQTLSNKIFDAGSGNLYLNTTGYAKGLEIQNTQDGNVGAKINLKSFSNSPAIDDYLGVISVYGKDSNNDDTYYGFFGIQSENVTDTNECGRFLVKLISGGVENEVLTLSSSGVLAVDDSYDTFDSYDDAELLREGISNGNRQLLLDAGILIEKKDTNGNIIPGKYMIQFQQIIALCAGGIYQNRDYIELLESEITLLESRLATLEAVIK